MSLPEYALSCQIEFLTFLLFTDSDTAVANIDASKVSIICHDGDDICDFGDLILLPHLTYAEDVASASAWIVEQLDL